MDKTYDFIIVGGGSAGCVLAARLSASAGNRVLLIEAGGNDSHPFYRVPAGFARMTKGIGSWGWYTVPQRHMDNMVIRFTQARVIGGGSTINAQIYTRGHANDYDHWRELGCEGWGYEQVLPYFKKSEDNDSFQDHYHAQGGPLGVSQPSAPLPICEAYFAAAAEVGLERNHDLAGASRTGVGYYQLTQRHAQRSSTASAFLRPALGRPNLTVHTQAQARRILLEGGRAVGVEYERRGRQERARCDRELVLSSGAIGSPRLLMLSGIGPAKHLQELGIPVELDLAEVGANLQDHLDLFTICECSGDHSYDKYAQPHWSAWAGLRYLLSRSGPAASSLFETGGFATVEAGARNPDLQLHLGLGSGIESGVQKMTDPGITLNSAYLRPRSRGTVRLASSDPAVAPLIDPNYWESAHDREMAIRGLQLTQEIMRQPALRPFIKREVLPGPKVKSAEDYFRFACANAKTDHHPVGTCRMGSDATAVVDPSLRLRGVAGLRVADSSIMPRVVSANTNATTIMIAEKAADMILAASG